MTSKNEATPTLDASIEPTRRSTDAEMMKAIDQDEYGSVPEEVLRLVEIDRPTIGDDEVLVRVRAASVDRGTWHLMTGLPNLMRIMGFGFRRPKALNPGRCLAGTVEAVDQDVTEFTPGDEIYGTCDGSFAEYAVAQVGLLARKPGNLSFEQAAAVPVSGMTALQGVRDRAQVQPGEKVLIIGASGGVGSTAKVDLVRSLGADHIVDYTRDDFADGERRYDAILDIGGNSRLSHLRRALTHSGRLVIVGGETGGRWLGGFDRQLRAIALSPLVTQKLGILGAKENASDLSVLRELLESGNVTPTIDRTFPLSEVPAAMRYFQEGNARGKLVITV
jgi:NADPH:quinone reductase-like Zn-dependent oxidoreductase